MSSLGGAQLGALLDSLGTVLTGEPARIIGYGGAVLIYLAAKALGSIPDQTPEEAITQATAALVVVGTFVESIRHFVYSPNTVDSIVEELDGDGEPGDTT